MSTRTRTLFVALCAACFLPAQAGLTPAEAAAFAFKAAGRDAEARDAFLALLAGGGSDARGIAERTFHAGMAMQLAMRVGGLETVRAALRTELGSAAAKASPAHAADLRLHLLELDRAAHADAAVAEAVVELGFLHAWRCIGPFDNERGDGMKRGFGPEQGVDLRATYDGKKRPVAWRIAPVQPLPAGVFDLAAIVQPQKQVLCYVATVLRSETEQDVALRLGNDGSCTVFCNGRSVFTNPSRRTFAYDQDVVPLRLAAGANLLLLKFGTQDGGMEFAARLTTLAGARLRGVSSDSSEDAFAAAAKTKPLPAPSQPADLGALGCFATGQDPADALRRAFLLAMRHPDDPNDRRDHELAKQAVAALPADPTARYLLAYTRVRPALHAAEREDNPRRHDYEAIVAAHPQHAEALRALAEMDLESIGAARRAEELSRRALAVNPGFAAARTMLARALGQQQLPALAAAEFTQLLAAADSQPPTVETCLVAARFYEQQGNLAQAERCWRLALAARASPEATDALAAILRQRGKQDEALTLLRQAIITWPFAKSLRRQLAQSLELSGRYQEALEVVRAWLAICPEDDASLVHLARLQGLLGQREATLESLRLALLLNPNLKEQRRHLEFLEAETKPFHHEFELHGSEILAKDPGAQKDAATANDPYYYLLDQRVVRAYRNGTTSDYRHLLVRMLTEAGARRFDRYRVPHYGGEQRARLLDALVHKKDGSVERPRLRGDTVDFPPLQPGDAVEIRARIDDLAPGFFGDYFGLEHRFSTADHAPSLQAELTLVLEPGREYRIQQKNGVPDPVLAKDAQGNEVRRWRMANLPRGRIEEHMPDPAEREPAVRVTTYRDWNHFANWWWNLIEKQLEVSPAIRQKVAEVTAGKATPLAKIAAIYGFVTTEINYQAWEFGVHGYKPYSTPAIFERRHGDCKDKALLLCAMLGQVGVEAYPVLIFADPERSTDDLELALVNHFNHCITYLPAADGRPEMFLDGTATWHPLDTLPDMDRGAQVLVVRKGSGDLRRVPWPDAAANLDSREITLALTPTGDAEVGYRWRPALGRAVEVRERYGNEIDKRKENLERELQDELGKLEVKKLTTSDLADLGMPVELDASIAVKEFAARDADGLVLKAALGTAPLLARVHAEQRAFPLLLPVPHSDRVVLRYRLPAGFAPLTLPEPVQRQGRFGAFSLRFAFEGDELRVEHERSVTQQRIEPAEYPEFREFQHQLDQALRQVVVVRKKGGKG